MVSTKGMAFSDAEGRPRLTAKQKDLVERVIRHAFADDYVYLQENQAGNVEVRVAQISEEYVARILSLYPVDRSCHTCDYLAGERCLYWKQDAPSPAHLDAGCDEYQTDGAPF